MSILPLLTKYFSCDLHLIPQVISPISEPEIEGNGSEEGEEEDVEGCVMVCSSYMEGFELVGQNSKLCDFGVSFLVVDERREDDSNEIGEIHGKEEEEEDIEVY